MSVRHGVGDVGNLLSSVITVAAAIVTAGLLNPVLAPVVLLAAVPNGWASVRAAMLSYESFVRMISRMRRLGITSDMIIGRSEAAEVRAFTTQHTLLSEHRRIGSQLATEAVAVEGRKTAIRLIGRGLAGVGTALAYGVLGLLLYAGAMPLALAGAAAVAMRTASKSTLAKVITGLYLPDQGRVSWDGVDIAQVDQVELHSQVAVVSPRWSWTPSPSSPAGFPSTRGCSTRCPGCCSGRPRGETGAPRRAGVSCASPTSPAPAGRGAGRPGRARRSR